MSNTTVSEFATELKKPVDTLLDQLKGAGVPKAAAGDVLTDADKQKLLSYLQISHGTVGAGERKKITLTKKSTTEIKQADATGKARTIQVEVRKKRTFVQRDEETSAVPELAVIPEPTPEPEITVTPAPVSVIDEAEAARRATEAARQAEFKRRQESEIEERRLAHEAARAKAQERHNLSQLVHPLSFPFHRSRSVHLNVLLRGGGGRVPVRRPARARDHPRSGV